MKSRRNKIEGEKRENQKKSKTRNQLSKIWSSVLKWFKSLLTVPAKHPKQPAKKKRKKTATVASRSSSSKLKGGRASNSFGPPAKFPVPANKLKGSPRRQFVPKRRSPAAGSFTPHKLQGPPLIDRVLKNLHRHSDNPTSPGPRNSKLSRKSSPGPGSAKKSLPGGKQSASPLPAQVKVNLEPVVKKLRGLLGTLNLLGRNQADVLAKFFRRTSLTSDKAPQQGEDRLSYTKSLQQAVARFLSPANAMLGHATKLLKEGAIPHGVIPNQQQRLNKESQTPAQASLESTSPWEAAGFRSDSPHRDEPTANSCGGCSTATYSISDARFNNVPKRPLKPIR